MIACVGRDGAYDTKKCHGAITEREALVIIPGRRKWRSWRNDGPGTVARNETLRAIKQLGRIIWKKWPSCHRRSLVETQMHCLKLLSGRVTARTFGHQITELKIGSTILNLFSQTGPYNNFRYA